MHASKVVEASLRQYRCPRILVFRKMFITIENVLREKGPACGWRGFFVAIKRAASRLPFQLSASATRCFLRRDRAKRRKIAKKSGILLAGKNRTLDASRRDGFQGARLATAVTDRCS